MPSAIKLLERIDVRRGILGGKPTICDMRIAVEDVLAEMAAGATPEAMVDRHPLIEPEDIQACLLYAYYSVEEHRIVSKWFTEVCSEQRPSPEEIKAKKCSSREIMDEIDRIRDLERDTTREVDIDVMLKEIDRGRGVFP